MVAKAIRRVEGGGYLVRIVVVKISRSLGVGHQFSGSRPGFLPVNEIGTGFGDLDRS
jgi:hypothetical protein